MWASKGVDNNLSYGFAGCSPYSLSPGLALLPACSFPWQVFCVCDFLGSPLKLQLHSHSFTMRHPDQGCLAVLRPNKTNWPLRLSFEISVTPKLLLSSCLQNQHHRNDAKVCCELFSWAYLIHRLSDLCFPGLGCPGRDLLGQSFLKRLPYTQ
jgi:hypothetical protein